MWMAFGAILHMSYIHEIQVFIHCIMSVTGVDTAHVSLAKPLKWKPLQCGYRISGGHYSFCAQRNHTHLHLAAINLHSYFIFLIKWAKLPGGFWPVVVLLLMGYRQSGMIIIIINIHTCSTEMIAGLWEVHAMSEELDTVLVHWWTWGSEFEGLQSGHFGCCVVSPHCK